MINNNRIENEIMALERESCRRFQAGDLEGVASSIAEDILLFNPGSELISGKEHEQAALAEVSKVEGLEMFWEPTEAYISASEDMAWVHGNIKVKTPDGNEQFEKYVTIWMKLDNEWKVVAQIRNSNT